jgi:hypothetical protein
MAGALDNSREIFSLDLREIVDGFRLFLDSREIVSLES